jgi:inner membrane protein
MDTPDHSRGFEARPAKVLKSHSATVKIIAIAVLVLLLLIPSSMISSLISEREYRKESVVQEISAKWGGDQSLIAPYITVPYTITSVTSEGKEVRSTALLYWLPEALDIQATLTPEIRYRSIFEAVLYQATLDVSGHFVLPALKALEINAEQVAWDKAELVIGVSDLTGIRSAVELEFTEQTYEVSPGMRSNNITDTGMHARVAVSMEQLTMPFRFRVDLNGSRNLQVVPLGKTTTLDMQANWPTPSFDGAFLPVSHNIDKDAFSAQWSMLHYTRNYPQVWSQKSYQVHDSASGVSLIIPADPYQKATRLSKYALMLIVFTFAAFFFSEILNRKRVHPIQYLLVGLAVVLFYALLIALSEHIDFDLAYGIAAVCVTAMISLYARYSIGSRTFALTLGGILTSLYLYMYIVLQLQDYALLMGSIGLFLILALTMYITRHVDWYNLKVDADTQTEA